MSISVCVMKLGHVQNCIVASNLTSMSLALKVVVDESPPGYPGTEGKCVTSGLPGFPKYPFIGSVVLTTLDRIDPRPVDS